MTLATMWYYIWNPHIYTQFNLCIYVKSIKYGDYNQIYSEIHRKMDSVMNNELVFDQDVSARFMRSKQWCFNTICQIASPIKIQSESSRA